MSDLLQNKKELRFRFIIGLLSGLLYLGVGFLVVGCSTPEATPAPTIEYPTAVKLPATWTPEVAEDQLEDGASDVYDATATWTPTATPTPPATNTYAPFPPEPIVPGSLACSLIAGQDGVVINQAPWIDNYRVLPTMEPGVAYDAVRLIPTYVEIYRDGRLVGWVDYRLLAVSMDGPSCEALPSEYVEENVFPHLCYLKPEVEQETYFDPYLNDVSMVTIRPDGMYIAILRYDDSYFMPLSHAGPSVYADADKVDLEGNCGTLPASAEVVEEGWLWSSPGGTRSSGVYVGDTLYIQAGGLDGDPPQGRGGSGRWYQALTPRSDGSRTGWIWSGLFEYK